MKILFIVETHQGAIKAAEQLFPLALKMNGDIIALNISDILIIKRISQSSDKSESEIAIEMEEDGWKYLYYIEEMAKNFGVKIFLEQEEGYFESVISKYVDKFQPGLLAISCRVSGGTSEIKNLAKIIESIRNNIKCPMLLL